MDEKNNKKGHCYHCAESFSTKNKQYCRKHYEQYKLLFEEFQEFYEESTNNEIAKNMKNSFEKETRKYVKEYINGAVNGLPISLFLELIGESENYVERMDAYCVEDSEQKDLSKLFWKYMDPMIDFSFTSPKITKKQKPDSPSFVKLKSNAEHKQNFSKFTQGES